MDLMPSSFKTEAIVLRSIRYGEADRVLHLYPAERGRVGAVAKGVRRVKSRLGGRLEPLSRVRLVLHQGRGELCTVSQADTVRAHAALRERREALERASQACEAVLRLLDSSDPNPPAYNLLCNELALLEAEPERACRAQALAFRLKLLLAAGFAPELAACASCGAAEQIGAFSPSGNAPAAQPPQTTPPWLGENAPRCSVSPHDAHDASSGANPAASSSLMRKASACERQARAGSASSTASSLQSRL